MRKVLPTLAAVMIVTFVWVMPAAADWIIDDGHKMHFPQLPDVVGWDVNATAPLILADDFECSETGWIKDIHFWGSWMHGIEGQIISFNLSIHADIPAAQNPDGYSKPGLTLWEREIFEFIIADPVDPPGMQGWYDPAAGVFMSDDHEAYFQYNVFLPEEDWFWQEQGTIYWLNITATIADPAATQWGVKTTLNHWNDDAVWALWGELFWIDMYVPPFIYNYLPGDVNGDGLVDISDVTYLINYLQLGGPPPPYSVPGVSPPFYAAAGVNGDCVVALNDATPLQSFVGGGGPAPTYCPSYPPQMLGESLDLAFVITGGEETGACCYPDPTTGDMLCVITDLVDCGQNLGGVWQGPGTTCGGMEACCLPDGFCVMADALCCVNELGGTPQGAGSTCSAPEACCMPDGSCIDLDPLCCADQGGTPQGPGTFCTQTVACCLPDGTCRDVDPECCDDIGGTVSPFSQFCLGDNNGNNIDDACEDEEEGACCYTDPPSPDMDCVVTTQTHCEQTLGGDWQGPGTTCLGMQACCLQDGSCVMADALCCVSELGGTPQGAGSTCSAPEACCMPDGSCMDLDPLCCLDQGGTPQGPGTVCLGDHNGDGVDDQCGPGWGPEDPHKMHYPQLPDEAGWDVNATQPLVLADDWMCSETGWVKDVHFWGSWMHEDEGRVLSFWLSIHEDIPAEQNPDGYSKPGETIWEREITRFQAIAIDPPVMEGWYDPMQQLVLPGDHSAYFQYNIYLDSIDWFWQQAGTIYWLNISAVVEDPINTQWGWKSTLDHWNDDAVWAQWGELFWLDMYEPPEFTQSLDLSFVITGEAPDLDTCEYYKDGYLDYCPNGLPDFDQKQDTWISPFSGSWSWCGPTALANCIWWFDSKFEPAPVSPVPFGVVPPNDNYPLITPFGQWDDHDPNNVMPFIQALMPMCNTDGIVPGTILPDLDAGFHNWITAQGLADQYTTYIVLGPEFEEVRDSILSCQDVILLLGFYELFPTGECQWLGGHYVTSAGVCIETTDICISDPMLDKNEGGIVHGAGIHNDASLVSGPHGSNHHDRYNLIPNQWPCPSPATWMFTDYPNDAAFVMGFHGQNPIDPMPPGDYQGNEIIVLLDAALIICPADTGCCVPPIRGDVNYDGGAIIDIADLVYLTDYMFSGGPVPVCYEEADVVPGPPPLDIADLVYLVDYMFTGGPPPPACP